MTNDTRRTTKLVSLAAATLMLTALGLSGCAADDAESPSPVTDVSDDDLTPEEAAAGAAWAASNDSSTEGESAEADENDVLSGVPDAELTTPDEDSAPYIDHTLDDSPLIVDVDGTPLPPLDETSAKATSSCKKATGYRSGKKLTICVTTVNGKRVEINTARAFLRMRSAAAKRGVHMVVVSGFRTMEEQRYLYRCYKTKRCNGGNLAAPPGYSNHQSGHALDLNTSAKGVYSYLANHGSAYRFKRTVPSERWHWEHW